MRRPADKIRDGLHEAIFGVTRGSGSVWRDLDVVLTREQWAHLNADHGTDYALPFCGCHPFSTAFTFSRNNRMNLSTSWGRP